MEEPELEPVFHSRLARTLRRRLLKADGTSAGWLIINAADSFVTAGDGFAASSADLVTASRDTDDPPQLAIPSQR